MYKQYTTDSELFIPAEPGIFNSKKKNNENYSKGQDTRRSHTIDNRYQIIVFY